MTRQVPLLAILFATIFNGSIYAQEKFVSWPDKNILNELRDFTDIYQKLDTAVYFEDATYPLNVADGLKVFLLTSKHLDPNDPVLKEVNTPRGLKEIEKLMDFEQRLRLGFTDVIRQRVILEQYRFAHLNSARFKSTISKLETSLDSIRWHLYEYNEHPRSKSQIARLENEWANKTCCNYFKWHGDFLTLQNLFTDLEKITNHFRQLWEIRYEVEDSDFEQDHMPKHAYNHPASYYQVDFNNTSTSYIAMGNDVDRCRTELQKLAALSERKIADTSSMSRIYHQNKQRWLSSLVQLQDSITTSKTLLEDSTRQLKRAVNHYKRLSDSIGVIHSTKLRQKDSVTLVLKAITVKITDSTKQELFLNKMRRQYAAERDEIYKKCGDPNCKDSAIIAELKVVNGKIDRVNDKLDAIGNNIDNLQVQKRDLSKTQLELTTSLVEIKQTVSDLSRKLIQAIALNDKTEKAVYPVIKKHNDDLEVVVDLSEMSKFFFALKYD